MSRKGYEFDHELSEEEIAEILENFDYDAWLSEFEEGGEPEPIYDRFGNPTRDTFAMMYEDKHGLGEQMTWEEFCDELKELYEETEPCENLDREVSLRAI